jgi:hypothetical protein
VPRPSHQFIRIPLEPRPNISVLAPNLFFSVYQSGRVLWKKGVSFVTREDWNESRIRESEYNRLLRMAMDVLETCPVSEEYVGGPGFSSVLVTLGGRVELFMRIGRIGDEPFPASVVELLIEVESLIQRLQSGA